MIQIQLEHPKHGVKVAYNEAEAEADKKNGWKEVKKEIKSEEPRRPGRPRKEV